MLSLLVEWEVVMWPLSRKEPTRKQFRFGGEIFEVNRSANAALVSKIIVVGNVERYIHLSTQVMDKLDTNMLL
jgi:hypothetical protein